MKRLLWLLPLVWLFAVPAQAQPYVVCDEYTTTMLQPEYFNVVESGVTTVHAPEILSNQSKRLHVNVGAISIGTHSWKVAACVTDPWDLKEYCSDYVPFSFTRSAVPAVSKPSSIGLVR